MLAVGVQGPELQPGQEQAPGQPAELAVAAQLSDGVPVASASVQPLQDCP